MGSLLVRSSITYWILVGSGGLLLLVLICVSLVGGVIFLASKRLVASRIWLRSLRLLGVT